MQLVEVLVSFWQKNIMISIRLICFQYRFLEKNNNFDLYFL